MSGWRGAAAVFVAATLLVAVLAAAAVRDAASTTALADRIGHAGRTGQAEETEQGGQAVRTDGAGRTTAAEGATHSALAELGWLAGAWVLEREGERLEEYWSGPAGNSMVGHFRWIRGDTLWITELVSITAEGEDIIFRLRHFSSVMRPWEAADDPFVYRLTDPAAGRATFSHVEPRAGRPHRFIFEVLPGDSLLVRLEGEEDGRPTAQEFRYGRGR